MTSSMDFSWYLKNFKASYKKNTFSNAVQISFFVCQNEWMNVMNDDDEKKKKKCQRLIS